MMRSLLVMFLAAFALPLVSCSGGEGEGDADNGGVEGTEEGAGGEQAGAEEASMNAGAEAPAAVCCGGGCDAPAGYCCSDGTCHGNHAELPIAP